MIKRCNYMYDVSNYISTSITRLMYPFRIFHQHQISAAVQMFIHKSVDNHNEKYFEYLYTKIMLAFL